MHGNTATIGIKIIQAEDSAVVGKGELWNVVDNGDSGQIGRPSRIGAERVRLVNQPTPVVVQQRRPPLLVQTHNVGPTVQVQIDGKPFTDFVLHGGNAMKPYLYPLRSAAGKLITRKFPMETVQGEPTDHPHRELCAGCPGKAALCTWGPERTSAPP